MDTLVKTLIIFMVAISATCKAQPINEVMLEDFTINHISHPLLGQSFGISKEPFDKLLTCNVIFPNVVTYEAYPNFNLPAQTFTFSSAVEPFRDCSLEMRAPSTSLSGTYELISISQNTEDCVLTVARRKFHLNVTQLQ